MYKYDVYTRQQACMHIKQCFPFDVLFCCLAGRAEIDETPEKIEEDHKRRQREKLEKLEKLMELQKQLDTLCELQNLKKLRRQHQTASACFLHETSWHYCIYKYA